jgi:hypothetical protein
MNSPDAWSRPAPSAPPTRAEVEEDHRHVEALLDRLEVTTIPWRLTPLLQDLHRVLVRHFQLEEGHGGPLDMLSEAAPSHGDRVEALIRDHRRMLNDLQDLIHDTQDHPNGPPEGILHETRRLVDRLRRHEEEENLILGEG